MSRMSVVSFLTKAKHSLIQSIRSKGEQPASFVIGNESADLDSITCALLYGYIQSNIAEARKSGRCIIPITNIPSSELRLRPELEQLLTHVDIKPSDLITLDDVQDLQEHVPPEKTDWALVDHNNFLGELGRHFKDRVTGVIDHHEDEGAVPKDAKPRIVEKTGSCCSHVVESCRDAWGAASKDQANGVNADDIAKWDAQLAKLALGPILIDTVNLKATDKVTDHDRNAAEYLESKIAACTSVASNWDRDTFFEELNDAKSNLDGLSLEEILRKDYKQWSEGDLSLGISSSVRSVDYLKSKTEDLVPVLLDFAKGRNVQLYAVMTASNNCGEVERQLLLIALEDGKPRDIAENFAQANSDELKLEENDDSNAENMAWMKFWEQKNLKASRKQVAPMIREAMKCS